MSLVGARFNIVSSPFNVINYLNAINKSFTVSSTALPINRYFILGGGNSGLVGRVTEFIHYEGVLSAEDNQRVNSYLALKYGITLNTIAQPDYVSSNGSTIWSGATNLGFQNNIFGIGFDKPSGLTQKQSNSINLNQKLIIGAGSNLANTNVANTNTLNDGQFLIVGDNGLAQRLNTPLAFMAPGGAVSGRFDAIWKVQNTGSVGTVTIAWPAAAGINNLHLVRSTDATINASDEFIPMSGTVTINGVAYNTAQVTLNNGNFFTFAGFQASPGGALAGLRAWYRADAHTSQPAGWPDQSGNGKDLISGGVSPTWTDGNELFNFNPQFSFTGVNRNYFYNNTGIMGANSTPGSIYGVAKNNGTTGNQTLYGFGDDDPNMMQNSNGLVYTPARDNSERTGINFGTSINTSSTNIPNLYWNASNGFQAQYNGTYTAVDNFGGDISDNLFVIGTEGSNFPDGGERYNGRIPEVVVYNLNLTGTNEAIRINTYLGVKYGVTLSHNYLSSSSTTVWDRTANSSYNNNIFGVARDNISTLHQKQSKSVNVNQKLIVGAGTGLFNTNPANSNTLNDNQFLMVGDNGLAQNLSTPIAFMAPGGEVNYRFNAIWKVQNTGSVGTVTIAWPASINNLHLVRSTDETINTSDEFIPMSGTVTINGVAYNTAQVTLNNGNFFTFAGFQTAPGGVLAGLRAWYKANAHSSQPAGWPDQSGNGKDLISGGVSPTWTVGNELFNFNPHFNFTGVNQNYFYNNTGIMGTNSTPGSIYGVARSNGTTDWQTIYGFGDDNPNLMQNSGGLVYTPSRNFSDRTGINFGTSINTSSTNIPNLYWNVSDGFQAQYNGTYTAVDNIGGAISDNLFVIGSEGANIPGNGNERYNGRIPEVAVYNLNLTGTNEAIRINTYLGVKYGVTLSHNYLSSNSTTVWDRTANSSYNNNIFGVARDKNSDLHQKQSISVNVNQKLIVGAGTGLFNTNVANSNTLNDNQYLMVGDNGLAQNLNIPLAFMAPGGEVNHRFNAIWKVQNTGSVGTVTIAWPAGVNNLHLVRSIDATINASDEFIPMSGAVTINGIAYNTAQVTLNNGNFFTFAGSAVGPGGVVNPDFWVKSDDAGVIATAWKDQSNLSNPIENVGAISLNSADAAHNFHPFTTGYSSTRFFRDNTSSFAPTANYIERSIGIFSAVRPTSFSDGRITGTDNENNTSAEPYLSMTSAGMTRFYKNWGTTQGVNGTNAAVINRSSLIYWNANNTSKQLILGNNGNENTSTFSGTIGTWGPVHIVGYGVHDLNGAFPGDIMEVIWYNKELSVNEIDRVNSYLAIKNGVTFTKNYLSANSVSVWTRSINPAYNNNIFGIAFDSVGILNQKVSNSINPNTILKSATINNFSSSNGDGSRTTLNHGQYEMFGDNNNTSTTLTALNPVSCPALSDGMFRIAREWRVQETGTVGSVWLEVDINAYSISSDIVLYYGDNAGISGNTGIVNAFSVSGGKALFNVDFKDNATQYFTIAGKVGAPACATCRGGKYIIRQGNSWNTAAKILNDSTGWFSYATDGEGTNLQARSIVTYTTPSNEWVDAWYPSSYGSSALMPHVGTTNGAASKRVYTTVLNRASKVNFELAGISEWYGNKVKVVVKGYCGAGQVTPIITEKITGWNKIYNGYSITGNTVIGNKYYRDLDDYSRVKVNFNKPVERIEIEYTLERNPVRNAHFWFTVGDMAVECESPIEPNKDNVYIKQSFEQDTLASCNNAIMKIQIKNQNCNERTINISNTLPTGLEYIANSYESDITSIMPTYSGTNFSLSNIQIPSGETNLFIKVKPTDTVTSITTFNTQSNYNVTIASGGTGNSILSDDMSALAGLQPTKITFTPASKPAMPRMKFYSGKKSQSSCDTINYTIEIDNTNVGTTMSGLVLQPFLNLGQIINGSLVLSSGLSGTVQPNPVNGSASFLIPQLNINSVGIHKVTFSSVVTQIDEFAVNVAELFLNPAVNECAISAKVSAILDKKCPTCENGKGFFNMKRAWTDGGASARTSNSISNIIVGSPETGIIKASATVEYPNASTEWLPTTFPRQNGSYTELSRYDNLNSNAGMVRYIVDFKDNGNFPISARPSFEIAGATKYYYQTDQVKVYGICGDDTIVPKLNYAYNSTTANNNYYRRFTINKAQGTMTGTQPYYDNYDWAKAFVEFETEVHKVVVEWKVDRAPSYTTLGSLYIGDISLVCRNKPEPVPDNVYIIASFLNDSLLTCKDATIKLNVKNWNCDTSTITITNNLTGGLVYVDSSYVGLASETPTYSGSSFTLNNLKVPSGNSYLYVKVRPSDVNTSAAFSEAFFYTVSGGINDPNPYRSDDNSGQLGYQNTSLKYSASAIITPKPKVTLTADKICYEVEGDTIHYTVAFENNTGSTISNVEFSNPIEAGQNYIDPFSSTILGGTVILQDSFQLEVHNMTLPIGTSLLKYRTIVNRRDSVKFILNSDRIVIDPTSECAEANTLYSNLFRADTAYYNPGLTTGTPKTSNMGITTLNIHKPTPWPGGINNAWLALESRTKGLVITRTSSASIPTPIEGMFIYDTTDKCFKLYSETKWKCISRQCKEN
jgi:uncharacterized repeat protein (TIGR01451 family)